ncbi:MAG: glucose-1-phosphate adenylyltransferase subunit GlgD [Christensenellales bacterium]|jgi:glucose-1-phosphate adenylyltransferase
MIIDAMGIIYTGENSLRLKDLTYSRSAAAVPIGGRYRLIDFMLSDLVNSGITNVGVITQRNYHSIMDHLGAGKEWDLNRKRDGLFILPPFGTRDNVGSYKGDLDALKGAMSYIRRSKQRYCIVMNSNVIFNSTFEDLLNFHIDHGADITVMYTESDPDAIRESDGHVTIRMDDRSRIWDMEINAPQNKSNNQLMGVAVMEKGLLENLVEDSIAHGNTNFTKHILLPRLDELRVYGFKYPGYVARIDSVLSYYKHNMALLDPAVRADLLGRAGDVYTKVKDEVPARYESGAKVSNCLVADGCIIEGEVENSILFRGVRVGRGARIRNSIIMQSSEVMDNARLDHVILDKQVLIRRDRTLSGQDTFPVVIGKNAVI